MKKKILVVDSFYSETIANTLQELYGEYAEVYYNSCYHPFGIDSESKSKIDQIKPTIVVHDVDIFFLSAKIVLQGDIDPMQMKNDHGKPDAKVVVMSTMPIFLRQIREANLGVDFFYDKDELIGYPAASCIPMKEKKLLLSYIK